MAKQTRNTLKGYFETGDIPTQGQYQDLIDSYVSLNDTEINPQIINTNFSASGAINTLSHITASGNISSSGTVSAEHLFSSDDAEIKDDLTVRGDIKIAEGSQIRCITNAGTHIELEQDDSWLFETNGFEILRLTNVVSQTGLVFNESGLNMDFRVETAGDTRAIFVNGDGGSLHGSVQIGSSTSTKLAIGTSTFGNSLVTINGDVTATHITASGNISASGNITGETGSFDNGIILTAPNGNKFRFTVNNSGHLSVTGSAV